MSYCSIGPVAQFFPIKKTSGLPLLLQEKVAQKSGGFYRTCVLNGFLMTEIAHNVCVEGIDAQESCNLASMRVSRGQFHVQNFHKQLEHRQKHSPQL